MAKTSTSITAARGGANGGAPVKDARTPGGLSARSLAEKSRSHTVSSPLSAPKIVPRVQP